jgi:hypothetical protein
MPAAAPIRALLAGSIDYAGLFPPASLELEPALANHGRYVHDKRFMDARHVRAADCRRFEEYHIASRPLTLSTGCASPRSDRKPRRRTSSDGAPQGVDAIRDLSSRHGAIAGAVQIEIALPSRPGATIDEVSDVLADINLPTFLEAPFETPNA